MNPRLLMIAAATWLFSLATLAGTAPERVLLLANSDDRDSVELARYYADRRGIPEENLIALPLPRGESIDWATFRDRILLPLRRELIARERLDAVVSSLTDAAGRPRMAVSGHDIGFLVCFRGVPLRIDHDPELQAAEGASGGRSGMRKTAASVDGELSLLAMPQSPVSGFVRNPLFRQQRPGFALNQQVVRVARLDGPEPEDVRNLINSALEGERLGLAGRAYIDYSTRSDTGNRWLEEAETTIARMGFDLDTHRPGPTLPEDARFDAPAIYLGWYSGNVTGPFTNPGFRFPPGAIAVHIHSYSAASLRNPGRHWCAPFIRAHVAATVGNVTEPYLELSHHPGVLMAALADGKNWGEAGYASLPVLGWAPVLIGDPLYQPFQVTLDEQITRLEERPVFGQYAAIRQMRLLERVDQTEAAVEFGHSAFRQSPGLALGLALARLHDELGERRLAASSLRFAGYLSFFSADDWCLARDAARQLAAWDQHSEALRLFRNLINDRTMPFEVRRSVLESAISTATAAGSLSDAAAWRRALDQLAAARSPDPE